MQTAIRKYCDNKTKETKLCKHCQSEISKNAKVCPNCRKKQNGIGKWIAIAIVLLLIIGVAAGGSGDDEPKKSDTPNSTSENSSSEKATDVKPEPQNEKTTFVVGETAELNGVQVTMTSFEESTGKDYVTPTEGNVFALAEFEIVNNTNSEMSINK